MENKSENLGCHKSSNWALSFKRRPRAPRERMGKEGKGKKKERGKERELYAYTPPGPHQANSNPIRNAQ